MIDPSVGHRLLERWRRAGNGQSDAEGPAPVSAAQNGVMVFERLQPQTAVFNLCFAARHSGPLNERRFNGALTTLIGRHPALRSVFVDGPDGPRRVVGKAEPVCAEWVDLSSVPVERRPAAARQHAEKVAAVPFDLRRGPLVRIHGCRLGPDERLLVFVAHHLVCDGGSLEVLLRELDAAYRDELVGIVPESGATTSDSATLDYWREQLADVPALDLPADRRPARRTFRAGSVAIELSEDLEQAAQELAREQGATLFMVLLAAFQLLLGEHTGQTDFAVGAPEAGRWRAGQHTTVGLLADLLVLRADLSGRPTFRQLVQRSRRTCLSAFDHRGVPFEEVVAALAPGHSLDGALVQACLTFHGERGEATLANSPLRPVGITRSALRYAVDLHLWRERGRVRGTWDYSADIFERETAIRMARRLPAVLTRVLAAPDVPVADLDLLTDDDRALITAWTSAPTPAAPDSSLLDLFAEQVSRAPDAVAVTDATCMLTYRALDQRSNQLAHYLHARGIGVGDVVGIRLPRTVDLPVAMLGILKAGAAYLPLDPAYPAERTDYMVRDSSARMIVSSAELHGLARQPSHPVTCARIRPDLLAYVLYTSGSTGLPKGVLLTHRNAVSMVRWAQHFFSPAQMARVLASTSICFDVSVFEFFGPLCTGGTAVVVDNALSLLTDQPDVTMVCAVPSVARALVAARAIPATTRVIGLGGEAVTGTLVEDLYATSHPEAVVNLYGPTEDTTYSTYSVLAPDEYPIPIGVLLPHERGYVLNGALQQVAVGAVGELYLAGRGLSRGYIRQPALTASRYVADPFAQTPGARMYRTGDLVRYRSDGKLLYLGRRDFQIKVRGQRIELGEIENTLQRHPEVQGAVVTVHNDRLVGYLTSKAGQALDLADVRTYLRRTLPVVMVPSSLLVLDAFPHTPNGKIDRLALPAPDATTSASSGQLQGPDEELVAEVWREVMDLAVVGRDDDFFDLGGDSLLAGRVLSVLRERAGVRLPLRAMFENSRLADLAQAIRSSYAEPDPSLPEIEPRPANADPVLSLGQQRLWLEHHLKPTGAYNVHGRQWLHGLLDIAALEQSIRVIIGRHEVLRTTFPLVDGQPVPRVAEPDPHWRLDVHELSAAGSAGYDAARLLADRHAAHAFDLADDALFDCMLIRASDTDYLLSITIHHIVCDGWSIGLFLRELSALYAVGGDPDRATLPALPVQYRDYAIWERTHMTHEQLAPHLAYWQRQLAGVPPAVALPTAYRRRPAQGTVGGRVTTDVDHNRVAALRELCRKHEATPFMVMLATLATLLCRWSGQDDIVVGVPVNSRSDVSTQALIGFFVNTVPIRVDLSGNPSFEALLGRTRAASLEGYVEHGQTPFDLIVDEVNVGRDPSRTPLFQVMLNMIDIAEDGWQLSGLAGDMPEVPPQPSQFDLVLYVRERRGALRLDLQYHADRYDSPSMQALLSELQVLLSAVVDEPSRGILDYDVQPVRPEPPNAVREFVPAPYSAVVRQAESDPDRLAVTGPEGSALSYRQLADAACRLATTPQPPIGPHWCTEAVVGILARQAATELLSEPTDWAAEQFSLGYDDRLAVLAEEPGLCMSALSTATHAGACLAIAHETDLGDPQAMLRWLHQKGITAVYLTAPLLRALMTERSGLRVPRLRYAFVNNSGDLTGQDVEHLTQLAPNCQLVALFHPTATGQPLAAYAIPTTWQPTTAPLRIPIGATLAAGTQLIGPGGLPAAVGEVAQLRIQGSTIPAPVRRRADSLLEYAGAPSTQLAAAPHNDPLEAEVALRSLPDVRDAVVTERAVAAASSDLIAYVAADPDVDLRHLKQHLITQLPEWLIPDRIVVLDHLPLNRSGRYDLTALPDPCPQAADMDQDIVHAL